MATSSLSPAFRSFVRSTATGFSHESPLAISLPLRRSVIRLSAVAVTIPFLAPPANDLESRYSPSSLGPQIQSASPLFTAGTSAAAPPAGCFSGSCSQRSAAALRRRPKPESMRSEPRRHAAAVRNGMEGTRDGGDTGDGQAGNGERTAPPGRRLRPLMIVTGGSAVKQRPGGAEGPPLARDGRPAPSPPPARALPGGARAPRRQRG